MADQTADAKGAINQDGLGASSASDGPLHSRDSENIIPTVEFDDAKAGGKGAEGADKGPDKGKEGTDKGAEGEDDRFDKHPRFQELNQRMKDAEERAASLEAKIEELTGKGTEKGGEDKGREPLFNYEDITKWSDEEIREKMEDNPKGFMVNLFSQIVDETVKILDSRQAQQTRESTVKGTFDSFASKHPGDPDAGIKGFNDLWKAGAITKFMNANPGHNAMSAYLEMTAEAREKAVATKAAKAAEEEARKNKEAKAGAKVLGAGPGGAPAGDRNADLKDTKVRGGLANVIAQRLAERRRAQS